MRRAWLIASAVTVGGGTLLLLLAKIMGWDDEVVGVPVLICVGVGVLVLMRAREDTRAQLSGSSPGLQRR